MLMSPGEFNKLFGVATSIKIGHFTYSRVSPCGRNFPQKIKNENAAAKYFRGGIFVFDSEKSD
ncbi:hypothetical protein B1R32_109124 [Abditibacterium utsteinense]|uniref:Uncharacterized protein n=1 Tax=Abditibacterium utsteinense TaxID=1960156 RepID=A0A2S8SSJ1_9BACT|nr:hypothetical protein B1R32_109124 [Abditibacterium utsteinense]